MTIAELQEKVDTLNGLFMPRRKKDPPHFDLRTRDRRTMLIRWRMAPTAVRENVTEFLPASELGAFLDAFTAGVGVGREKGVQSGLAKAARAQSRKRHTAEEVRVYLQQPGVMEVARKLLR